MRSFDSKQFQKSEMDFASLSFQLAGKFQSINATREIVPFKLKGPVPQNNNYAIPMVTFCGVIFFPGSIAWPHLVQLKVLQPQEGDSNNFFNLIQPCWTMKEKLQLHFNLILPTKVSTFPRSLIWSHPLWFFSRHPNKSPVFDGQIQDFEHMFDSQM